MILRRIMLSLDLLKSKIGATCDSPQFKQPELFNQYRKSDQSYSIQRSEEAFVDNVVHRMDPRRCSWSTMVRSSGV